MFIFSVLIQARGWLKCEYRGQDNLQGQSSPCTLLRQLLEILLPPLPISWLERTGITYPCATVSGFSASGGLNPGPHARVARYFSTELYLQPFIPPRFQVEFHRVAQLSQACRFPVPAAQVLGLQACSMTLVFAFLLAVSWSLVRTGYQFCKNRYCLLPTYHKSSAVQGPGFLCLT